MKFGLKLVLLAAALLLLAGLASGLWLWTGSPARAGDLTVGKADASVAPVAKVDDDDDDEDDDADDDDDDDDDGDDDEEEVTIDQVPEAVRATILKEAAGNPIKEIEVETKNGKKIYEAEWVADGKEIEIEVAEDGTLLKKEVDDD